MKNLSIKTTALVLAVLFTTMQVSASIDTGLGQGLGGAVINGTNGGSVDVSTGQGSATLTFDQNTHVVWDTLNLNNGETLNFNAVDGVNGLTIINSVENGMSYIYGTITANDGISKLIISNPNGMLYDGAHFTTAGDLILTTARAGGLNSQGDYYLENNGKPASKNAIIIKDSDFKTGGDMTFLANNLEVLNSVFKAKNGAGTVKFETTNGQDFVLSDSSCSNCGDKKEYNALKMEAIDVNGNLYIVTNKGKAEILNGGKVSGDFTAKFGGNADVNVKANGKYLEVGGNVNVESHNQELYIHNTKVGGNLTATNDKGLVEVGSIEVNGNADLRTYNFDDINNDKYNHFIHVVGNNTVKGDMNIVSAQNIHIGGYVLDPNNPKIYTKDENGNIVSYSYNGTLADGSLNVGGNLNAKTEAGHIATTVDVTAKNINLEANMGKYGNQTYGGSIISDGKSVLTADTYQFKADGYIGAIGPNTEKNVSADNIIINIMETYQNVPKDTGRADYLVINGGTITKLDNTGNTYISSKNDLTLTGANAGDINLVAPDKFIRITGPDVHASNINIGGRTDKVQVDFPSRDFTLNYTNIRDGVVKTIKPNDVITYKLTNDPKTGYNTGRAQTKDTTYLVGPEEDQDLPIDEAERNLMARWVPEDAMKAPVDTPVAFAADLDEDENGIPIRKNVDGSVTVVRKMTPFQ